MFFLSKWLYKHIIRHYACANIPFLSPILFCISNDTEESSLTVDGKEILPVYRVEEGLQRAGENTLVVLCTACYQEMGEQLGLMGYSCGKDYIHSELFRVLVSSRKIAMVYGVCYTRSIHDCLKHSEDFILDYEIFYWLSYKQMTMMEYEIFLFMLSICDLYLYNACISPVEQRKNHGFLKQLPQGCQRISIPLISLTTYHPQSVHGIAGNNPYCIMSAKTSWAPFLSPDWNINRMLDDGRTLHEILAKIRADDFYKKEKLQESYSGEIRRIQIQERIADIKISDYLIKNHGKKRLFLNETHISNYVIIELTKRILDRLGYSTELPEEELLGTELLHTSEVPLYPSVIEGLSLDIYKGKDITYDLFTFQGRKKVTFEEYVEIYCDFCGNMMRFIREGLFPE